MNDEYISREAVFQVVHGIARGIATKDIEALKAKDMKTFYKIKGAKEILDSVDTDLCYIPAADVQSVKHGKWIDCTFYDPYEKSYDQNFEFKCSRCGHLINNKPNDDNWYCGHCGADMRNVIQNSQELIYKKACGVDVKASIEAQKSWEQWRDNVKAIQESNLLETEVEGLYLNIPEEVEEGQMCETCKYYNNSTHWCSQYNDTTYNSNCSSYQVKED